MLAILAGACSDAGQSQSDVTGQPRPAGMLATGAGAAGPAQPATAGAAGTATAGTGGGGAGAGAGDGGSTPIDPPADAATPPADAGPDAAADAATALDDEQTLIPDASWTCGMPDGIPGPLTGEPAFHIEFEVGEVHDLGATQYGKRLQIDVTGGTVTGRLEADVLSRGLDYQLTLDTGAVELEQVHVLRAGTANVYMRNCGVAPGPGNVRVVLDFEAPNSSAVAWLNTGTFVGTREFDAAAKTLRMQVYEVSGPADMAGAARVVEPDGVPDQSWECAEASGTRGDVVYMETVGIGGSVSVGASKRGTRNIIPITGGSTSGRIAGSVLDGGADFQLIASGAFVLDARYTLRTSDGELIIVRNCGPTGALVPVFETRADGNYAWVNENAFLSSNPGIAPGAVNLTIYERR